MEKIEVKTFVCGPVQTNCYVVSDIASGHAVVIDCEDSGGQIADYLRRKHLQVDFIALTHAHSDHIGGVEALKKEFGGQIAVGKKDEELLLDPMKNLSAMMGLPVSIEPDRTFSDGDTFSVGGLEFQVIETPGHTKGSVCYIEKDMLFSGDTLFAGSCGRTDFYSGSVTEIRKSLLRLAALSGDYTVYPGHMGNTTLSYERQTNPFLS